MTANAPGQDHSLPNHTMNIQTKGLNIKLTQLCLAIVVFHHNDIESKDSSPPQKLHFIFEIHLLHSNKLNKTIDTVYNSHLYVVKILKQDDCTSTLFCTRIRTHDLMTCWSFNFLSPYRYLHLFYLMPFPN